MPTCRRRKTCPTSWRCARPCCRPCPTRYAAITSANGRSSSGRSSSSYGGKKVEGGRFHVWIRTTERLPDDPAIHQCVLAYASDMTLLDASLAPHGRTLFERSSWRPASTMLCGCTGRSAPTTGCFMPRICRSLRVARLLPRTYIHPRRHPGRLGGTGGIGARSGAEKAHLASYLRRAAIVISASALLRFLSASALAASGKTTAAAGLL